MTTLTTDIPPAPPPPPPKARRKPRSTPPPPLPAVGTPVLVQPDPASGLHLDLGATLAEVAEAASRADGKSDSYTPNAGADPAAPPPGRLLEDIAGDYRGVFHGSLWECARFAAEAVRAHGDTSLARLAQLADVDRPRLVEHALLGRYWGRGEDRVTPASASAHLYAARLARKRLGKDAADEEVIMTARIILLQSPDCKSIQAQIRAQKHAAVVPPPVDPPEEPPPVDGEATAFEAVLTSLHGVRDYLASSPPAERFTRVVDALQAILAEANAAREVRVFEPDENLDDDDGEDDGDDDDGLDSDDGADDDGCDFDSDFEE